MIINNRRLKGMQGYKEKGCKDYLIIDVLNTTSKGMVEGLAASIAESPSSLSIAVVSEEYLAEKCRPVSWKQIPKEWKDAFIQRLEFPEGQFKESTVKEKPSQKKLF